MALANDALRGDGVVYLTFIRITAAAPGLADQAGDPVDQTKIVDPAIYQFAPVHILRWYDDAWSQSAVVPPAVMAPLNGVAPQAFGQPGVPQPGVVQQ